MATFLKCKMCGGDIEVSPDMTVGTCLYCGSTMTIPRVDSEKKARIFNHANTYRINCEFDKAYDAYKSIIEEDEQEAEAYWGMLLSEYGVEYVEDPNSHKRIPTCHRTHILSIRNSSNFKLACKYADAEQKMLYQDEAEILDKLQKRILAISDKEDPYDVFICYKETDDQTGERTEDSVLAQSIYDALTQVGIRVFFSRISLEDKLGADYEPFIYAALKSAKVMLVVSIKEENCNATWVKNEWMRFLDFKNEDESKTIIPVYRDMSPKELPDEFAQYQAQDMGKIGAIQDLVYGVQKIVGQADTTKKQAMSQKDILDIVKEDALQKRRHKISVAKRFTLKTAVILAAVTFAVLFLFACITFYKSIVKPLNTYKSAMKAMNIEDYSSAIDNFKQIDVYKDSHDMLYKCYINNARKCNNSGDKENAIIQYKYAEWYADDGDEYWECMNDLANIYREEKSIENTEKLFKHLDGREQDSEYAETALMTIASVFYDDKKYGDARSVYESIKNSDRAAKMAIRCQYDTAYLEYDYSLDYKKLAETLEKFEQEGYPNAKEKKEELFTSLYVEAESKEKEGDIQAALEYYKFLDEIGYKDSDKRYGQAFEKQPQYIEAYGAYSQKEYSKALSLFKELKYEYYKVDEYKKNCEAYISERQSKFIGTYYGHGNWWGADMSFTVSESAITPSIGQKYKAEFSYEDDCYYIYDIKKYIVTVSGNTLHIRCPEDPSASFVGDYRRTK